MQASLWLKFLLRNLIFYLSTVNTYLANLFIAPLKVSQAKKLKEEVKAGKIKKVLINRSDRIGDAIISLKLIRALADIFENVYVIVSEKNAFIFKGENKVKTILKRDILLHQRNCILSNILYFFKEFFFSCFKMAFGRQKQEYDLLIDLIGDPAIERVYNSRYMIGPNKGLFSIAYSCFCETTIFTSNITLLESYKKMMKDCLDIDIKIDDAPPNDFSSLKKKQIFIFVGNVPKRNLSYERWKEIILVANSFMPCIVADDPLQNIMNKLKKDKDIINNKNIKLITDKKELEELVVIANRSILLIALDGGGEHFLERYTNALILYTCGLPAEWKPYSVNTYSIQLLETNHVYEETTTSAGLKKFILYKDKNRRPCRDLLCNYPIWKDIDVTVVNKILQRFMFNVK